MALQTVLRRVRSNAPSLAHHLSGDSFKRLAQFGNPQSTLTKRAINWSSLLHADIPFVERGYSSEASLIDIDNNSASLDSLSNRTLEETSEPTADGVNLEPKISKRHNLAMLFTCTVCQTRSAKTMSRETYEKGVVIVRCGGCKNLHLIADRLGWFGEPGSVEDFLKQKGVEIRKGTEESYEFSVEDLAGWSAPSKE